MGNVRAFGLRYGDTDWFRSLECIMAAWIAYAILPVIVWLSMPGFTWALASALWRVLWAWAVIYSILLPGLFWLARRAARSTHD